MSSNDAQIRADLLYSAKTTPAAGDKLVIRDQADGLPKTIDWNQLPSGFGDCRSWADGRRCCQGRRLYGGADRGYACQGGHDGRGAREARSRGGGRTSQSAVDQRDGKGGCRSRTTALRSFSPKDIAELMAADRSYGCAQHRRRQCRHCLRRCGSLSAGKGRRRQPSRIAAGRPVSLVPPHRQKRLGIVSHANVAHRMRTGKACTPENTSNFSSAAASSRGTARGSNCPERHICSNSAHSLSDCSTVRPRKSSVISEPDARQIAHPWPTKGSIGYDAIAQAQVDGQLIAAHRIVAVRTDVGIIQTAKVTRSLGVLNDHRLIKVAQVSASSRTAPQPLPAPVIKASTSSIVL